MNRTLPSPTAVAWVLAAAFCTTAVAAEPVTSERSVPGSVVPSTGTTAGSKAPENRSTREFTPPRPASGATAGDSPECAALRRQYAQSQACFAKYRVKGGGLRPEAFKHCRQIKNPSVKCGSAVVG